MDKVWLKTKDVAEELQVSPGTVLKWIKRYDIPHSVNANGHYYFDKDHLNKFFEIKESTKKAAESGKSQAMIASEMMIQRLAEVEDKSNMLEKMIGNKADEIIGFQLIEQRREVRALHKKLEKIEKRLTQLDEQTKRSGSGTNGSKKDKSLLAGIFSV